MHQGQGWTKEDYKILLLNSHHLPDSLALPQKERESRASINTKFK